MSRLTPTELRRRRIRRFWERVEKRATGCWEWTGATIPDVGYGVVQHRIGPRSNLVYTHRFSWELHFGPIPKGMCVLHDCDNRKCVRPIHLFLGTRKNNTDDMVKKGRASGGRRGLTEHDVRELRRLSTHLNNTRKAWRLLGLSDFITYETALSIVRRRVWKSLA